jgi:ABC-type polysaccharide/polyol phosphate transport system ATPase subunit
MVAILGREANGLPNSVEVDQVSVRFNMAKERVDSLKEYFIKLARRQLRFEAFMALTDVSFTVARGEVFGIVGLNGSGKSTLLKVVSGILKPTAGSSRVYGSISPLIELGAGFDQDLTARENIFLNGSVLGFSRAQMKERFAEIVDFAELHEFIDVAIKNYSSGMIARLGFAIATITQPDVLILDEILAVGDFLFQQKCETRITEMMRGGATVLIVSHSIDQIERLCHRVLWLEHGRARLIGPTTDVCRAYAGSR